jgi:CPA1 family monovalent cation:H+ antiporter
MDVFNIVAVLTTLTALFAWVNHRYVRLPNTIGLMLISLAFSVMLVSLNRLGVVGPDPFVAMLERVRFDKAVLDGMLGALLFAGALHVKLEDLKDQWLLIGSLATLGVLASAALVGLGSYVLFGWLGLGIPLVFAFLFGALISPTDPIAVAAILKKAGVPRRLETVISGESLFNDGVGVVLFLVVLGFATGASHGTPMEIGHLLAVEVGGGILFGAAMGWVVYHMLARVDQYGVEILLTLAIVTGGYAAAQAMHISGPLAMVVAGLLIGNPGRAFAMSELTVVRLDEFWELVDEILNAILFVMIGMEVLILEFDLPLEAAGLLAIPVVLMARFVSVAVPVTALRRSTRIPEHAVKILTWGGLRGGISVALALSLPPGPHRDALITVTYIVVVFSIVVQGLSIGRVAGRLVGRAEHPAGFELE